MKTAELKELYDNTAAELIQGNLNRILRKYDVKPRAIVKMLAISIHTAYAYRKTKYSAKPDLIHLMIISEKLRLDIDEFFKPLEEESGDE